MRLIHVFFHAVFKIEKVSDEKEKAKDKIRSFEISNI